MHRLGLFLGVAVWAAGCGGPVCGNGLKEVGEECDAGALNGAATVACSATCKGLSITQSSIQVVYQKLPNEAPGFSGASCAALGIKEARVRLDGPTVIEDVWPCSYNSKILGPVIPGDYRATITLYDANGTALTNPVTSTTSTVATGGSVDLVIPFHQPDFLKQDYRGNLYFATYWDQKGTTCDAAKIKQQSVQLRSVTGGPIFGVRTTGGRDLNFTPAACFSVDQNATSEVIKDLTWGHYDLTVAGYDHKDEITHCQVFDVFVGPTADNPTYSLIVNSNPVDCRTAP